MPNMATNTPPPHTPSILEIHIDVLRAAFAEEQKKNEERDKWIQLEVQTVYGVIDDFKSDVNVRFDRVDERFDRVDERFEKMEKKFDTMSQEFQDLRARSQNSLSLAPKQYLRALLKNGSTPPSFPMRVRAFWNLQESKNWPLLADLLTFYDLGRDIVDHTPPEVYEAYGNSLMGRFYAQRHPPSYDDLNDAIKSDPYNALSTLAAHLGVDLMAMEQRFAHEQMRWAARPQLKRLVAEATVPRDGEGANADAADKARKDQDRPVKRVRRESQAGEPSGDVSPIDNKLKRPAEDDVTPDLLESGDAERTDKHTKRIRRTPEIDEPVAAVTRFEDKPTEDNAGRPEGASKDLDGTDHDDNKSASTDGKESDVSPRSVLRRGGYQSINPDLVKSCSQAMREAVQESESDHLTKLGWECNSEKFRRDTAGMVIRTDEEWAKWKEEQHLIAEAAKAEQEKKRKPEDDGFATALQEKMVEEDQNRSLSNPSITASQQQLNEWKDEQLAMQPPAEAADDDCPATEPINWDEYQEEEDETAPPPSQQVYLRSH